MRKLLASLIVVLMIASAVIPVFAIPSAPDEPDPADNSLNLWVKDATLNVESETSVRMDVNITDNADGFTEMKIVAVYPACLTMTKLVKGAAIQATDFTKGEEKTEIDKILNDFFTEIGLDAD